jgi:hypothetical protein
VLDLFDQRVERFVPRLDAALERGSALALFEVEARCESVVL